MGFVNSLVRGCRCVACVLVIGAVCATPAFANSGANVENKLKAAYLVNIAKFVRWPDNPDVVRLCASASTRLYDYLAEVNGITIGNDVVLSVVFDAKSDDGCNMVYWDQRLVDGGITNNPAIVYVTDQPGGLDEGFIVQFFLHDLKLRMAINEERLDAAQFEISSKLLRLSRRLN